MSMLAGCQLFQKPNHNDFSLREKIRWEGKSASLYSFDSSSDSFELRDSVGRYTPLRSHHFEFDQNDTIRLVLFEFEKAYYAYSIFTNQVNSIELEEGLFRK